MNTTMTGAGQVGPAASSGGQGRRTMREALEIASELQGKYVELGEFIKNSCFDVNKAFPLPGRVDANNSDDEAAITISVDGIPKIKKDIDLDDLEPKELKRIKIIKKRRKFQNSLLCATNLVQFDDGSKTDGVRKSQDSAPDEGGQQPPMANLPFW